MHDDAFPGINGKLPAPEIYYFSGTGNSLAVARDIAERTRGKWISIPLVMNTPSVRTDADAVGVVFPTYHSQLFGIPLIIERFIKQLEDIDRKYLFAVCTCGGHTPFNALPALKNLEKIIVSRGGCLSAEFSIRLPMNSLNYSHVPFPNTDQETMFERCRKQVEDICRAVAVRKRRKFTPAQLLLHFIMTPLYRMLRKVVAEALRKYANEPENTPLTVYELMPLTDNSIYADETCSGCGICTDVCPVQNIQIDDNRPVWRHHCEMCLACVEWCPVQAIHHWCRVEGRSYHHPEVTLSDMMVSACDYQDTAGHITE